MSLLKFGLGWREKVKASIVLSSPLLMIISVIFKTREDDLEKCLIYLKAVINN